MTFRISALPRAAFAHLFNLSDEALPACGARRVLAGASGGYPCRVSLTDATPGETLILTHYEHQPADTPFRAGHAVYVREAAADTHLAPGEIPALLRSRLLSLRAFDGGGMMIDADVADGAAIASAIDAMLAHPQVAYLHLHYARPGCYAARVDRA
ncbi:DUF1203 domain-containing protein [Sphingomonas sp.]|uniref:DUF1203 domain-containing protein n=1 Tax=Sphingomonas sp. TaxID=28214 RepID=UPI003CC6D5BD